MGQGPVALHPCPSTIPEHHVSVFKSSGCDAARSPIRRTHRSLREWKSEVPEEPEGSSRGRVRMAVPRNAVLQGQRDDLAALPNTTQGGPARPRNPKNPGAHLPRLPTLPAPQPRARSPRSPFRGRSQTPPGPPPCCTVPRYTPSPGGPAWPPRRPGRRGAAWAAGTALPRAPAASRLPGRGREGEAGRSGERAGRQRGHAVNSGPAHSVLSAAGPRMQWRGARARGWGVRGPIGVRALALPMPRGRAGSWRGRVS